MIKIAICDDDKNIINEISLIVRDDAKNVVFTFNEGRKLLGSDVLQYDIIFLDIEIGDENGVDIANEIKLQNPNTLIFFVTSYSNYISNSMTISPFQYLVKPLEITLLQKEFNRALEVLKKRKKQLRVISGKEEKVVLLQDILYFETKGRKVQITLSNGEILETTKRLKQYACDLQAYDFELSHSSFLVNIHQINIINGYNIKMQNGKVLPISKKFFTSIRQVHRKVLSGVEIC